MFLEISVAVSKRFVYSLFMTNEPLPDLVKRALTETICSIGQLSDADKRLLDRYVKKGWLAKGHGGPFPCIKTVYAHPGFDFIADRERHYQEFCYWSAIDRANAEKRKAA